MFAPPPVQHNKAQIEKLKAELQAKRLKAEEEKKEKRKSAGSTHSLTKIESPNTSLQRTDSSSPKPSRKGLFKRNNKVTVSSPIAQQPAKEPRLPSPQPRKPSEDANARKSWDGAKSAPLPFAQQPRRAPVPPRRPSRAGAELGLPPPPGPPPPGFPPAAVGPPSKPPPPIPQKSNVSQGRSPRDGKEEWEASSKAIDDAIAQLEGHLDSSDGQSNSLSGDERPAHPGRASTAPVSGVFKQPPARAKRSTISGQPEGGSVGSAVQGGKVSKSGKRASAAASIRAALEDIDGKAAKIRSRSPSPHRIPENDEPTAKARTSVSEVQLPWKRQRKGETINELLDAGFFPSKQLNIVRGDPSKSLNLKVPPPLLYMNKDLPDTPGSMAPTPTELYQAAPKRPLPATKRGVVPKRRSPLAHLSKTSAMNNSLDKGGESAAMRLSAIPELASTRGSTTENSPLSSGATTPVATQIQLRNGSVLMVTPPELTAWERHTYIQGPIRLPKPVIMPRKNSVASLEAFQEAIDQVYQDALVIPRRRSDDAVVDDVCEWFDDYGFEDVGFEGDVLGTEDIILEDIDEAQEMEEGSSREIERFATPPVEPEATPIEKVVAKEVLEMASDPPIPPLEDAEALRARGIARLTQRARKESLTLTNSETMVALTTPEPEESMLSSDASLFEVDEVDELDQVVDQSGWSDSDPEEMNAQSSWAFGSRQRALGRNKGAKARKNPVVKMRRFMTTASTIL